MSLKGHTPVSSPAEDASFRLATMTSAVSFSFSCSDSALPITHQLPCFLGTGRSVIGRSVVVRSETLVSLIGAGLPPKSPISASMEWSLIAKEMSTHSLSSARRF